VAIASDNVSGKWEIKRKPLAKFGIEQQYLPFAVTGRKLQVGFGKSLARSDATATPPLPRAITL
jgi:hypothetical protein